MSDTDINSRDEYLAEFNRWERKDAFKLAVEVRKLELELYWKRATYFWAFIGAAFIGYVQLDDKWLLRVLVALIGFAFSVGWYCVNRGSKYWQINWERHCDLLEDNQVGPLFKLNPSREGLRFWDLTSPYPFSVTRVNHILNIVVIIAWCCMICYSLYAHGSPASGSIKDLFPEWQSCLAVVALLLIVLFVFAIKNFGNTDTRQTGVHFIKRSLTSTAAVSSPTNAAVTTGAPNMAVEQYRRYGAFWMHWTPTIWSIPSLAVLVNFGAYYYLLLKDVPAPKDPVRDWVRVVAAVVLIMLNLAITLGLFKHRNMQRAFGDRLLEIEKAAGLKKADFSKEIPSASEAYGYLMIAITAASILAFGVLWSRV